MKSTIFTVALVAIVQAWATVDTIECPEQCWENVNGVCVQNTGKVIYKCKLI